MWHIEHRILVFLSSATMSANGTAFMPATLVPFFVIYFSSELI